MAKNDFAWDWAENYSIRYLLGTVIGAVIIYGLAYLIGSGGIGIGIPDIANPTWPGLALLAFYGFVYCYIASTPMTVFHAGRLILHKNFGFIVPFFALALSILLVAVLLQVLFYPYWTLVKWIIPYGLLLATATVWVFEMVVVIYCLCRADELYKECDRLARAREAEANKDRNGGTISTYQKLREHGNSCSIVMLQFVLAGALYGVSKLKSQDLINNDMLCRFVASTCEARQAQHALTEGFPYLLLLMVWLAPAACVWLVATGMEYRFAKRAQEKLATNP